MNLKSIVNNVVNKYLALVKDCDDKALDMEADDDKIYKEWLEKITKQIAKKLSKDLVDICEDNEVMAECIKKYFDIKKEDYYEDEDDGEIV